MNNDFYKDIGGKGLLAVAFDFDTKKLEKYYNGSRAAAYKEMGNILNQYGFEWVQGSTYVCKEISPFEVCLEVSGYLKTVEWIQKSIKSFYMFEMKSFSNLTKHVDGSFKIIGPKDYLKRIK